MRCHIPFYITPVGLLEDGEDGWRGYISILLCRSDGSDSSSCQHGAWQQWDTLTWKTEEPAGRPSAISAAKGRFWKVGSLSFRSSRLTKTVALLVARRGGLPPVEARKGVSRLMPPAISNPFPQKDSSLPVQTVMQDGVASSRH